MRKKYFGEECVFEFVWDEADADGIWNGDAACIALEFGVSEDEAHSTLETLCEDNHIQRIGTAQYILTRWHESEEELPLS